MKIALVSEHASPLATIGGVDSGGQNIYVAELAIALGSLGVDVEVYTRREDPDIAAEVVLSPGVIVKQVDAGPPQYLPKDSLFVHMEQFSKELVKAWTLSKPDLIHSHFWMSGYASLKAAQFFSIPVVQTFHALGTTKRRFQGNADTSPPERQVIEPMLAKKANHLLATSTHEISELMAMGASYESISVIPCGVDLEIFSPCGPAEQKSPSIPRIVVVSRLVERKGIGDVVFALSHLDKGELVIAGGPSKDELYLDPEVIRLKAIAKDLGISHRVDFRGRLDRDELSCLYRSADVVVCVPWYEPFGMVALEATSCGVPVIASSVGGLLDTIEDGVNGILVPPKNPKQIAIELKKLLDQTDFRRSLGQMGVVKARSRYGWNQVANEILKVYEEVLSHSSVGTGQVML